MITHRNYSLYKHKRLYIIYSISSTMIINTRRNQRWNIWKLVEDSAPYPSIPGKLNWGFQMMKIRFLDLKENCHSPILFYFSSRHSSFSTAIIIHALFHFLKSLFPPSLQPKSPPPRLWPTTPPAGTKLRRAVLKIVQSQSSGQTLLSQRELDGSGGRAARETWRFLARKKCKNAFLNLCKDILYTATNMRF